MTSSDDQNLEHEHQARFDSLMDEHWSQLESYLVERVPMPEIRNMADAILTTASASASGAGSWSTVQAHAQRNVDEYYSTMRQQVKRGLKGKVSKGSRSAITQDILAAYAPKPAKPQEQPRKYVWGIVRNKVADYFRSKSRKAAQMETIAVPPTLPRMSSVVRKRILVEQLLAGLTERQRSAVKLRYEEGFTVDEGAKRLGVSRSTFKRDVEEGMAWMREQYGLEPEELG